MHSVRVSSCNLPPALLAEWPGSFYVQLWSHRGGTNTEITVSAESWPWRIFLSCCFCQDLKQQPFDRESGAPYHWAIPVPHIRHKLMKIHHHTTLGYKRFSCSEDIIGTNIISLILFFCELLWLWPWTQQSNTFTENFGYKIYIP